MSLILIYQQSRFPLPYEEKFYKNLPGNKHLRNARFFDGKVEKDVSIVYTNDDNVVAAYRAAGIMVEPIPLGEQEPRFKVETDTEKPKAKATRSRSAKPAADGDSPSPKPKRTYKRKSTAKK